MTLMKATYDSEQSYLALLYLADRYCLAKLSFNSIVQIRHLSLCHVKIKFIEFFIITIYHTIFFGLKAHLVTTYLSYI
jgi:hypothetical protein